MLLCAQGGRELTAQASDKVEASYDTIQGNPGSSF
jgi:hypothetical protein